MEQCVFVSANESHGLDIIKLVHGSFLWGLSNQECITKSICPALPDRL